MTGALCAVYILTNRPGGVLYTGVTSDLRARLWRHRNQDNPGAFSARYNAHHLVYFEVTPDIRGAIAREKQLKRWARAFKVRLIEKDNPGGMDLSEPWV